jgi:hypothetical protein
MKILSLAAHALDDSLGSSDIPKSVGIEGPNMSVSSMPDLKPF